MCCHLISATESHDHVLRFLDRVFTGSFWVGEERAIHMGFSVPSNNFKGWSNCGEKGAT
jgi:hypothetical protein